MEGLERMNTVLVEAFQHCERSQAAWDRLKAFGQLIVKGDPEHVSRLAEEFCSLSQRIEMTLTSMVDSVEVLHPGTHKPGERATTPDAAEALTALQGMEGDEEEHPPEQKEPSLLAEPRELLDASDDDPPIDPLDGIPLSQYGIQYTAEEMEDGDDGTDAGGSSESNEEMPDVKKCNCKKSRCLKLYCECFSSGIFCESACMCRECLNVVQFTGLVTETRQHILDRSPNAFAPKVSSAGGHKKGCHCKKSRCLKKYCECYQANVPCTDACRCENCKNNGPDAPRDESPQESFFEGGAPALNGHQNGLAGSQGKGQEGGSSSGSLHRPPQTNSAHCAPLANPVCNLAARAHPTDGPSASERRRQHPSIAARAPSLAPQGSGTLDASPLAEAQRREHGRLQRVSAGRPAPDGSYVDMLMHTTFGTYADSPGSAVDASDVFHMPLSLRRPARPSHLAPADVKQEAHRSCDVDARDLQVHNLHQGEQSHNLAYGSIKAPSRARSQRSSSHTHTRPQAADWQAPQQYVNRPAPGQPRLVAKDWAPLQATAARPSLLASFAPVQLCDPMIATRRGADAGRLPPVATQAACNPHEARPPERGSLAAIRAGLGGSRMGPDERPPPAAYERLPVSAATQLLDVSHFPEAPLANLGPDSANANSVTDKASRRRPVQHGEPKASQSGGAWGSQATERLVQRDWVPTASPGRAWDSVTTETSSGGTDTADDAISPPPPLTSRQAAAKTSAAIAAGYHIQHEQSAAHPPRALKRSGKARDTAERCKFQRPRVVSWGTAPAAPEQQRDVRWASHQQPEAVNYRLHGASNEAPAQLPMTKEPVRDARKEAYGEADPDEDTSTPMRLAPEILGEARANSGKVLATHKPMGPLKGLPPLLHAKSAPGRAAPSSKQIGKENNGHIVAKKNSPFANDVTEVVDALLDLEGGM